MVLARWCSKSDEYANQRSIWNYSLETYVRGMEKLVHTCISKFLSMIDSLHFRQTIILTFPTNFFELTLLIMTFHQNLNGSFET